MTYKEAFAEACASALRTGRDYGIAKSGEDFTVFALRAPENRSGYELRCEVVTPSIAQTWKPKL